VIRDPAELVDFWFSPVARKRWFNATPAFDQQLRERFQAAWAAARDGQLSDWEETAVGALALVLLLDQIPLNIFRNSAEQYSTEVAARAVAGRAIARGLDRALSAEQKSFLYLPYMHSEMLADQDRALDLYQAAGLEDWLQWSRHHRDIIRRFQRFPHRNTLLGRESTPAECAWLASAEGFSG